MRLKTRQRHDDLEFDPERLMWNPGCALLSLAAAWAVVLGVGYLLWSWLHG